MAFAPQHRQALQAYRDALNAVQAAHVDIMAHNFTGPQINALTARFNELDAVPNVSFTSALIWPQVQDVNHRVMLLATHLLAGNKKLDPTQIVTALQQLQAAYDTLVNLNPPAQPLANQNPAPQPNALELLQQAYGQLPGPS